MIPDKERLSYEYMSLKDTKKLKYNTNQDDTQRTCGCFVRRIPSTMLERRKKHQKLFADYKHQEQSKDSVYNSTAVLIALYVSEESDRERVYQMFQRCRLNPNLDPSVKQRNDLEYYIPQLINYLVFHEEMDNLYLINFITQASQVDFFFAHQVYFQLNSVQLIVLPKEEIELEAYAQNFQLIRVSLFLKNFVTQMSSTYFSTILIAQRLLVEQIHYKKQGSFLENQQVEENPQPNIDQTIIKGYNKKSGLLAMVNNSMIQTYGTNYYDHSQVVADPQQLHLKNYRSIHQYPFEQRIDEFDNTFTSTIEFWEDLTTISDRLHMAHPKIISLKADLQKINARLPAAVYVPFLSNSIRNYVVLNIVFEESRVFSTKDRAPFYVCFEVFRPDEEKADKLLDQFEAIEFEKGNDKRLSDPRTLNTEIIRLQDRPQKSFSEVSDSSLNLKQRIRLSLDKMKKGKSRQDDNLPMIRENRAISEHESKLVSQRSSLHPPTDSDKGIGVFYEKKSTLVEKSQETLFASFKQSDDAIDDFISYDNNTKLPSFQKRSIPQTPEQLLANTSIAIPLNDEANHLQGSIKNDLDQLQDFQIIQKTLSQQQRSDLSIQLFGETEEQQKARIKQQSPFKNFKSWNLVHLIVKTGDNLKQEQFAMQLISQINQIFQVEGLPMKLTTYDVISTGPSCGLIQMIRDATTIDSLKKNIHERYKSIKSMKDFFHLFYDQNIREASSNFLYSLVGYSLVCYFLQLKDRHNGNILLHRDGHLIHIDFGFLLSNSPGKGIELERKVPFKLLTEYVDILGGVDSQLFDRFRGLFFKGFQAIRKNKDKIMLLVKMMYSGHGTTLPCFKKGKKTIIQLENRFYSDVTSDAELYMICQNLINQSLNNWRARWYDKYQYYFQGIFY